MKLQPFESRKRKGALGNIQAGKVFRMLRPMGKASPLVAGKCRASTRPPSRVYQDSKN